MSDIVEKADNLAASTQRLAEQRRHTDAHSLIQIISWRRYADAAELLDRCEQDGMTLGHLAIALAERGRLDEGANRLIDDLVRSVRGE